MEWSLDKVGAVGGRIFLAARIGSLAAWPIQLSMPSQYFACLVIADGNAESTDELGVWASRALGQGMVFCAVWGPGCEVVDDVVDWAVLERDQFRTDTPVFLTTWHPRESLAEAIEFFAKTAIPAAEYQSECQAWLLLEGGEFGAASGSREILLDHIRQEPR